eukprot:316853-Prymnesium_polylepis.2
MCGGWEREREGPVPSQRLCVQLWACAAHSSSWPQRLLHETTARTSAVGSRSPAASTAAASPSRPAHTRYSSIDQPRASGAAQASEREPHDARRTRAAAGRAGGRHAS